MLNKLKINLNIASLMTALLVLLNSKLLITLPRLKNLKFHVIKHLLNVLHKPEKYIKKLIRTLLIKKWEKHFWKKRCKYQNDKFNFVLNQMFFTNQSGAEKDAKLFAPD